MAAFRSAMKTWAPSAARRTAVARPIPEAPPETRAALAFKAGHSVGIGGHCNDPESFCRRVRASLAERLASVEFAGFEDDIAIIAALLEGGQHSSYGHIALAKRHFVKAREVGLCACARGIVALLVLFGMHAHDMLSQLGDLFQWVVSPVPCNSPCPNRRRQRES